jgi:uncharacterized RDD family membrane protein YckC
MRSTAVRRLVGFGIDWLLIGLYAGLLFLAARRALQPAFAGSAWRAEAVGFGVLTVPVVVYFAASEASPWQATVGKRWVGVRVIADGGGRATPGRCLTRAAIKFAPWELAHFAIWHAVVRPDPAGHVLGWVFLTLANLLPLSYLGSLFVGSGRTPYDRASRTRVVSSRPTPRRTSS